MTLLTVVLAASLSRPASADGQGGRTLADCWAAALARSEAVAQQRELAIQARERARQATGALLPSLSAIGGLQWQESPGSDSLRSSFAPTYQTTARISATQPLFRGGREYAALRQARLLAGAQERSGRWAELQLFREVAASFYAVLSAERDLADLDTQLDAYGARIAELTEREKIGRSRTSEVLTAQAARGSLEAQGVQVRNGLTQARETLAFLTGQPADAPVADETGEVPGTDPLEAWLAAAGERPDVAAARDRVDAARAGEWVAKGSLLPSLDLTGNYYLKRGGLLEDVHWDAQLGLTIPLFTGGLTFSRIREAKSVRRQAEQALSLARRSAETEIRTLYSRLEADRLQALALARAAELARASHEQLTEEYRQGLVSNLDVLTALNGLQELVRALNRAGYIVRTDHALLEAAAGRTPRPAPATGGAR